MVCSWLVEIYNGVPMFITWDAELKVIDNKRYKQSCGGIGRRIAILSKKVIKYTVSTGEVDSSKTMQGANPCHGYYSGLTLIVHSDVYKGEFTTLRCCIS